ncbi:hypothetical protein DBZ36_03120 [Alginatibacterium sediminis]|uniref:Uncharacterized protein n=1 Tax=Alginatibacterium sediminis TaxID=2164068 RepID=A0A420EFJ0_9ALTE|nr:hypothetical protein [Alginatibacterium sediminis]RKF19471.1 hypothetical protein DBZ36_03120 [Alginatibacterium sediminis]
MAYKTWIFISETTQTFFMTTHVNFEGMTIKAIQRDILTWNRQEDLQSELDALSAASDFRVEYDEVKNVDDLHDIKARYVKSGYACLNRRIVLTKNNKSV